MEDPDLERGLHATPSFDPKAWSDTSSDKQPEPKGCCGQRKSQKFNSSLKKIIEKNQHIPEVAKYLLVSSTLPLISQWGDRARRNSRWHRILQVVTNFQHVAAPVLFALLQNADIQSDPDIERTVYWIAQATSVASGLSFALLTIFLFEEKHHEYSIARDELNDQVELYLSQSGPYMTLTRKQGHSLLVTTQIGVQKHLRKRLMRAEEKKKKKDGEGGGTPGDDRRSQGGSSRGEGSLDGIAERLRRDTLGSIAEMQPHPAHLGEAFAPAQNDSPAMRALGHMGNRFVNNLSDAAVPGPAAYGPAVPGPAAYGPAAYGPAAYGPAAYGPAAYGPAAYGPAAPSPAAPSPAVSQKYAPSDVMAHGLDMVHAAAAHGLDAATHAATHGLDAATHAATHGLDMVHAATHATTHGLDMVHAATHATTHGLDAATHAATHGLDAATHATTHGLDAATHGATHGLDAIAVATHEVESITSQPSAAGDIPDEPLL